MAAYGVCDSHVNLHPFRNDPDPCYGFRAAVTAEAAHAAIDALTGA